MVVTSRKLPTAYIYDANRKLRLRNDLDDVKDLPDFIVSADEIEEALQEAKQALIRILNKTPVNYQNQR